MAFEITHGIEDSKPILPPLHTLNLPFLSSRATYDNLRYSPHNSQHKTNDYTYTRRMSTSSSCTSRSDSGAFSRTTSPSPSSASCPPSSSHPTKFRLEPCALDKADAVILIPSSTTYRKSHSDELNITSKTNTSSESTKPLFLVGPALHQFRLRPRSSRPLVKGARVHPYRIVRNFSKVQSHAHHSINDNGLRRRSSTISFTGLRIPLQELDL